MNRRIDTISARGVLVTPDTSWSFVTVQCDGVTGVGEATLLTHDQDVIDVARDAAPDLVGMDVAVVDQIFHRLPFETLAQAAFSSAVMQAVWDLRTRLDDVSVVEALGGLARHEVPAYANINRATRDRSPDGFAATARDAMDEGFTAFKIAPFDEVTPNLDRAAIASAARPGLDRIARVRETVGSDARLMVDCHWRFSEHGALDLVDAVDGLGLHWLECPMIENDDTLKSISNIRRRANHKNMALAGCEKEYLCKGFSRFLEAGAYDVMMPDIKYAGGPEEMLRIEQLFDQYSVEFSPHNPTGPVAHAASVQICAAVPKSGLLEMQFNETELFDQLVMGVLPSLANGCVHVDAAPAGWGVALDESCMNGLKQTAGWSSAG